MRNKILTFSYNNFRDLRYVATLNDFIEGGWISILYDDWSFCLSDDEIEALKAEITEWCKKEGLVAPDFATQHFVSDIYCLEAYINNSDYYPADVEEICENKGWLCGINDEDVCYDLKSMSRIFINEDGDAKVDSLTSPITPSRPIDDVYTLRTLNALIIARRFGYKGADAGDAIDAILDNAEIPFLVVEGEFWGNTLTYTDDNGWNCAVSGEFARTEDGKHTHTTVDSSGTKIIIVA